MHMRCRIIFEDQELMIVYKPAGLATQSASVGQPDVVSELKKYLCGAYVGVVHRLDQPVEGLLVFAKTPKTAAHLTKQLSGGTLNKRYLAAVCGKPSGISATLVDYLRKDGNLARVVTGREKEYPDAKLAKLTYELRAERACLVLTGADACAGNAGTEEAVSLLEVTIETGRFHQIRAQLAHAGFPILGDKKYGNGVSDGLALKCGITSVALCAHQLTLSHPVTKKNLSWEIKPDWMKIFEPEQTTGADGIEKVNG